MTSMEDTFNAFVVRKKDSIYVRSVEKRKISDLPNGDVLIQVHYSSLNYKDALSSIGDKTVTRHYPHTPGIDAAGVVVSSNVKHIKKNEKVVIISFDLGANTPGGFGQFIQVPASWVMPLPEGLSLRESMIIGTAGFTAALAVSFINKYIDKNSKRVLVTGATGGVGSMSVAFLSLLGYSVVASTGKPESENFLRKIGANEIINRENLVDKLNRTLLAETWSGAIDTVGGKTLEYILKSSAKRSVVVTTGMVSSPKLEITVFPFILRGIHLIGTGASEIEMSDRIKIWHLISKDWKLKNLDEMSTEINLSKINENIDKLLLGKQTGRVIVNMRERSD